ncbi:MAG: type III pantothenate kinase [Acidimicrobiales bacterium]|jgi:type III pantothenate kinase
MLLAIDVGNTQTVIGLFESAAADGRIKATRDRDGSVLAPASDASMDRTPHELPGLLHHWRVATVAERTADEYALLVGELLRLVGLGFTGVSGDDGVDGMVLSSSVPDVTSAIRDMARVWFNVPLVVIEPGIKTGIPILYDNPKDVGADRVANAVGAIDLYGGPAIVVDMGTATTFDAISGAGEYLGGAITPGIEISMDALFEHAAALRRVALVEPRNVIGKSTVESIQSGAVYGYTGLVDAMCRRFSAEIGPSAIIATGGLAGLITPLSEMIQHHEPWLTLHGLRLVFERSAARDESGRTK